MIFQQDTNEDRISIMRCNHSHHELKLQQAISDMVYTKY